jgi:transposase
MSTTTNARPHDWLEGRRLRALALHEAGWKAIRIAEALGVTRGAVSQWLKAAREGGSQALRRRPRLGRQPRLTTEQRAQLPALLAQGAEAYGFIGEVWTAARVAEVIWREFGVRHHPAHVSRILEAIHWTVQKPIHRASQRNEAAIAAWRAERWPALQAKPRRRDGRSSSSTRPASTPFPS